MLQTVASYGPLLLSQSFDFTQVNTRQQTERVERDRASSSATQSHSSKGNPGGDNQVASESTFSTGGRILDSYRSQLDTKTIEALIYAQDWLQHQTEDESNLPTPLPEDVTSATSMHIQED